jgi:hypothetical protein
MTLGAPLSLKFRRVMGHLEIRGEGGVSDRKHPRHKHYTRYVGNDEKR